MQEPRTLLGLWHVGEYHYWVVEGVFAKIRLDTTISRKGFILQFLEINKFCLIDEQPAQRKRVRWTRTVLRNNDGSWTIVEGYNMLIVSRFNNGRLKRLGRLSANHVMYTGEKTPSAPCCEQTGYGIGETMLESRHNYTTGWTSHPLHIPENERRCNRIRFSCTATSYYNCCIGANKLRAQLRFIKVYFFLHS